jgi:hypothetical protein
MKLNKLNLFVIIWVIHLFIYYLVFSLSIRVFNNNYGELYTVLLGFILGFMGLIEQIPFFFVIPILLMLILIKTKLKQKWFIAYMISICFTYLLNYLWMYSNNKHDKILFSPNSINLIYFIVPSLIVSIACNWVILKKTYTQLGL